MHEPSTKALIEVARRIYGDDDNTRSASFLSVSSGR